jgi:hypothetical protein
MKSEAEKESDAAFFLANGKTFDEEAHDSGFALGVVLRAAALAGVVGFGWWLTGH